MTKRSEKDKMLAGENYLAHDPELAADRARARALMRAFNAEPGEAALRALIGACGPGASVRAPFYCDYGYNIALGRDVFLNFNCVLLDVARIEIGDGSQIGPLVQFLTADHPRDPALRRAGLESSRPIRVGRNVWIGGGAILLPGIVVGDDCIIGAGAIVTRDVPDGATWAGNPARPIG